MRPSRPSCALACPACASSKEELLYTQLVLNNVIGGACPPGCFSASEEGRAAYSVYSYPGHLSIRREVFMLYATSPTPACPRWPDDA